jgi:vacuolar-type H+-ATPase subunit H
MTYDRPFGEGLRPPIHVVPPADPEEDEALEAVAASLSHVSGVMDRLTAQLTTLTEAFGWTKSVRTTEVEIGRLFVDAQAHVDQSIANAHAQGGQIVSDAHAEARQIVSDASAQAGQIVSAAHVEAVRIVQEAQTQAAAIVDEARRSEVLHPEAVARLSSTIEGFARMNTELVSELSALRESLQPVAEQYAPTPTTPAASPVPEAVPDPIAVAPEPAPIAQAPVAPVPVPAPRPDFQPVPTYPPPPPPLLAG